jgi:hypothetical protein
VSLNSRGEYLEFRKKAVRQYFRSQLILTFGWGLRQSLVLVLAATVSPGR